MTKSTTTMQPRYKNTPRPGELQASLIKRLNRVIGQLNGVKSMIDENRYCGDVLIQLSAAENAIKSIERSVLENHLHTCIVEKIQAGDLEVIDEAMDLVRRVAK